jgi:hypothetical protein
MPAGAGVGTGVAVGATVGATVGREASALTRENVDNPWGDTTS